VHKDAKFGVSFYRTLRIPDDDKVYPLPAGLGMFPLEHIDLYKETVPARWYERGGVMLPMYQSEALWISFSSNYSASHMAPYPFAVKIAAGKIDAVDGKSWSEELSENQDYVVIPYQPWLDGFAVEKGIIRQFVAMPLGEGYTVEEQITGKAEFGGIQIKAFPMKKEIFEERYPKYDDLPPDIDLPKMAAPPTEAALDECDDDDSMGLGMGGKMVQDIYDDPFGTDEWDTENTSRCFVHLANSFSWRKITGNNPPTTPFTAEEYKKHKIPWFDYYEELDSLNGSETLKNLKSVNELSKEKVNKPLSDNKSIDVKSDEIIVIKKNNQVRDGDF